MPMATERLLLGSRHYRFGSITQGSGCSRVLEHVAQNDLASLLNDDHSPRSGTFYEQTGIYGSRAWEARETLLNGLEVKLPNDVFFRITMV